MHVNPLFLSNWKLLLLERVAEGRAVAWSLAGASARVLAPQAAAGEKHGSWRLPRRRSRASHSSILLVCGGWLGGHKSGQWQTRLDCCMLWRVVTTCDS